MEREETQNRDAVAGGETEQEEREARLRALQADLLRAREQAESVQADVTRAARASSCSRCQVNLTPIPATPDRSR